MKNKTTFFKIARKQQDYVILDCSALREPDLSWKAKGIHSYLMQLPEDWEINMQDLINRATDGRDGLKSGIKELIEKGYFQYRQIREKGKITGVEYLVFERPVGDSTRNGFSVNGFSGDGFSVNGKSATTNNELFTKDEKKTNDEWCAPSFEVVKGYFSEYLKDKKGIVGADDWSQWEAAKFIEYWEEKKWKRKRKHIDVKRSVSGWARSGLERGTYTRSCPTSAEYGKKPWERQEETPTYDYDLNEIIGGGENPLADKFRM